MPAAKSPRLPEGADGHSYPDEAIRERFDSLKSITGVGKIRSMKCALEYGLQAFEADPALLQRMALKQPVTGGASK